MNVKPNVVPASLLRLSLAALKESEELRDRLNADQCSITFGDGERIVGKLYWDNVVKEMCVDFSILFGTY